MEWRKNQRKYKARMNAQGKGEKAGLTNIGAGEILEEKV